MKITNKSVIQYDPEIIKKLPLPRLFEILGTGAKGLTDREAISRSKIYGQNEIAKKKKLPAWQKFFSFFKNPLVIILIIAAIVSGLAGEMKNSVIIVLMVFLSVILNFYQERKSNQAAEKIAKKLAVRATALRNGEKKEILTKYLVPGDIVLLSAGDIVPADGRLVESDDFFVNEAALTGESLPIEKSFDNPASCTLFSGTNVISGSARLFVTNTGIHTEYGRIAETLTAPAEINAFEIGIRNFGYLIIRVIIAVVLVVFLINAIYHKNLIDSLIFSIAIAVGITPELLPIIMSVNMAKGSINMAKKGVIVKRLGAIPDFGSMDILCTDKTGTLTQNKITLIKYIDVFGNEKRDVLRLAYINGFFETGIKSLLDKAILEFKDTDVAGLKKIDEIPYDFMRKRSSIIYEFNAKRQMITKGAPEEMFKLCSHYENRGEISIITPELLKQFNQLYENLSKDGLRVLAVAEKSLSDGKTAYSKTEEKNLNLAGFIAFYDPPKHSAKETLVLMKQYGIEVKIITGDSALVTKKICQEINFPIKGIISGEEVDVNAMSIEALGKKAAETNIFARFSPIQKERVILALKHRGMVVGYLGDGINDAPSLKNADVGISVENAVDIAKETADIILLKKGLKELLDGVIEGRKTFGNTMKYMMMALSSNFGNMASMIGAVLYLPFFPMLPGQILLNNFLYDTSQVSIPMDNVDQEYLTKPKHWDMKFIRNFMYVFGPISSIFDLLTFYLLFAIFHLNESSFQTGWFIESLATQVFVIYIIRTRRIPFLQSRPNKYLVATTLGAVLIGLLLATTFLGSFFGFSLLPGKIILAIFGLVIVYLILVEIIKQIFYRLIKNKNFSA